MATTYIQANPGFFVALFLANGPPCFAYEPIIAWRIVDDPSVMVSAVMPDGMVTDDISQEWAIKYPDGRFSVLGDRDFDTEGGAARYLSELKKSCLSG